MFGNRFETSELVVNVPRMLRYAETIRFFYRIIFFYAYREEKEFRPEEKG